MIEIRKPARALRPLLVLISMFALSALAACSEDEVSDELAAALGRSCLADVSVPMSSVAPGSSALLIESPSAAPGDLLRAAVWNRSSSPLTHGSEPELTDPSTEEPVVDPERPGRLGVGHRVEPGQIGPCVDLRVPKTVEGGTYQVVIDDARLQDEGRVELSAELEVTG